MPWKCELRMTCPRSGGSSAIVFVKDDPSYTSEISLFIGCVPLLQNCPGGIYKSGLLSRPTLHRSFHLHRSNGFGGSFSEFRTDCFWKNGSSSVRSRSSA